MGADAWATASLGDVVRVKPLPGTTGSIKFEFVGKLAGEDSSATFSFEAYLPNGRYADIVTRTGAGSGTVAARYQRGFVVPPEVWSMTVSTMLQVSASGPGGADLSRSAHIQLDGVEIVSSDSGVFLENARPDLPGDANRDGVVNAKDLLIVRQNYGTSPAVFGIGDFNGDDRVGPVDPPAGPGRRPTRRRRAVGCRRGMARRRDRRRFHVRGPGAGNGRPPPARAGVGAPAQAASSPPTGSAAPGLSA